MIQHAQDSHDRQLFILTGPTAVGKTEVAIELAQYFETEIVSADSRQIYRELSIGTAKPTLAELAQIKHHFIDEISVETNFTAADFERQAIARLESLFVKHPIVVCAGGTGLYLRALIEGFDEIPEVPSQLAQHLEKERRDNGLEALVAELKSLDPIAVSTLDTQNPHRVLRALAVCRHTGKRFSDFQTGQPKTRNFKIIQVCLTRDREELYGRINKRVDQMVEAGLEEEARSVETYQSNRALQTVGYKEFFSYFAGEYDRDRAIELIKQNSRRYAKRQMTWFRNQGTWNQFEADEPDLMKKLIGLV